MTTTIRLHITPLRPDLLSTVLGPRLLGLAQNVSYQIVETFPENSYGFVDLPEPDAKKLASKLNGAILKGRTMKVEEARPSKRSHGRLAEADEEAQENYPIKKQKRSKKDLEILEGHELEDGRKVKRGWTDSSLEKPKGKQPKQKKDKSSKHQTASKYSDKDELLFRTDVPPNKQDLDTTKKRKKGKKHDTSPTLIHEFEKTTIQPKFLRDAAPSESQSSEFVDGKGWVDQNGHLIEEEPPSVKRSKQKNRKGLNITLPPSPADTKPRRSKETMGEKDRALTPISNEIEEEALKHPELRLPSKPISDETSSSGTSSSESNTDGSDVQPNEEQSLEAPATPPSVHPLEALFKKPNALIVNDAAKPSLEVETSFSFFDRTENEVDDDLPPIPMTPFTSHDINQRTMRSAAPTPDTAHPSRFTSFASALGANAEQSSSDDGKNPSEEATQQDMGKSESLTRRSQSDFEKRFWAERGQNNRAWKARNRSARKETRQLENKLRRPHRNT